MSRCKQELMSEDDDTDRVLISSPLTARYRHMATRAVVVVVVWTARDEIQPRRFGLLYHCLDSATRTRCLCVSISRRQQTR